MFVLLPALALKRGNEAHRQNRKDQYRPFVKAARGAYFLFAYRFPCHLLYHYFKINRFAKLLDIYRYRQHALSM